MSDKKRRLSSRLLKNISDAASIANAIKNTSSHPKIDRDAYVPKANITPQDFIDEFKKLDND